MFRLGLLLLLFFGPSVLFSQPSPRRLAGARVEGVAPSYAGRALRAEVLDDYITGHLETVGTDTVGPSGTFVIDLSITEPRLVRFELGVYLCYFFIEPGEHFSIGLPTLREKSEAERLNPYFEPVELQLKQLGGDSTSLNARIAAYDHVFSNAVGSVLPRLREKNAKELVDSAWKTILVDTSAIDNPFLRDYIRYRQGFYIYLTHMNDHGVKYISDNYFRGHPVLYNNPAYMDLFTLVYDRYFLFHGRTSQGHQIGRAISQQQSLTALRGVLRQNQNLGAGGPLEEMVILKGLHDEFFSDNFSRRALSVILDSLYHQTEYMQHKSIAMYIRERITRLLPGFVPRPFALQDVYGKTHTMLDYRGKLILLMFCSTASYSSIQDFALVERILQMYGEHMVVLAICVDKRKETIEQFVKNSNYPWPFLYYGTDPDLIRDYDVRAYPTYFLLDEDGKLLHSPAPSPRENLDFILHYIFRDKGWTPKRV